MAEADLKAAWEALRTFWYIPPQQNPLPKTPTYSILRMFLSPILRGGLRWQLTGMNHIPRKGPTILAANHLSHIDPVIVIAAARRTTYYLAKEGHFTNPFTRIIMKSTGQIRTERAEGGLDALASASSVLEAKQALGIFPEGTRSKRETPPYLLEGKTGVARLAASHPEAHVIPIALIGTREIMQPSRHKFPRFWKKIQCHAGPSLTWYDWLCSKQGGCQTPESLNALSKLDEQAIKHELATLYRKFTDQLMANLSELGAP